MKLTKSFVVAAITVPLLLAGCTSPQPAEKAESGGIEVKRLPAGAENAGFLSDYSELKPDPDLGGEVLSYVNPDRMKDLHRYVAMIVDPVEVYVASDADPSQLPADGVKAAVGYFEYAIRSAVSDAFPIVEEPGPLVLRLRSALVGVDVGDEASGEAPDQGGAALPRPIRITDVIAEFELVDSDSGETIAAATDKAHLGERAEISSTHFERMERFEAAREAFEGWARRLREFLDSKHELKGQDAERALEAYPSYGR